MKIFLCIVTKAEIRHLGVRIDWMQATAAFYRLKLPHTATFLHDDCASPFLVRSKLDLV